MDQGALQEDETKSQVNLMKFSSAVAAHETHQFIYDVDNVSRVFDPSQKGIRFRSLMM